MSYEKTFQFKGIKGVSISSVTIKETDGNDETIAAERAESLGKAASVAEEIVRMSIVAVDGVPVKQPYMGFNKWNSRTRAFVLNAWRHINAIPDASEISSFLESGEDEPEASPADAP